MAVGLHLAILPLVHIRVTGEVPSPAVAERPPVSIPGPGLEMASVELLSPSAPLGELLVLPGAGDHVARGQGHLLPNSIDAPGQRPATAGGVGPGGPESHGERRYRERAQSELWNGKAGYRQPRARTGRGAGSDEWMTRSPERGFDDQRRERRRQAKAGAERGTPGVDDGVGVREQGEVGTAVKWETADPIFDRGARQEVAQRRSGDAVSRRERPLAERGETSSDTGRRGDVRDDRQQAAASRARHPDSIDLVSPSAGGRDRDLRGDPSKLGNAPGWGGGRGSAASSRGARGDRGAVRAWRGNPYFRRMYAKVDKRVRFPKELALALEQGDLVVRFVLDRRGQIAQLKLTKPSGFAAFDRQVMQAIRGAAPFGPVPPSLLAGKSQIVVLAPYTFRNPLIR